MSTAKYIAYYNNTVVNIDETFNERNHGVDSYKELPDNFELLQFNDEDTSHMRLLLCIIYHFIVKILI